MDLTEVPKITYSHKVTLKEFNYLKTKFETYFYVKFTKSLKYSSEKTDKIVNKILQRKSNEEAATLSDIKMYSTIIIIRIRYKYKNRQTYLHDIIDVSEVDLNP